MSNIQKKKPTSKSLHFPQTGYYITREGWKTNDKMLILSAGLDDEKPDHQHGDMLGIQAYANGQVVLPNYQVRYSLKDLELFKNSMVKNVALVDDVLQGREYTSNKGGSGFGKFRKLPDPNTIVWKKHKLFDLYSGSHNGFNDIGVDYSRQVIYVRDDFWIVKDNFYSKGTHTYKQVWQGHYSYEHAPQLLRASFDNGSGFDILQMNAVSGMETGGARGKSWNIVTSEDQMDYSFITVLFPYKSYDNRIDEGTDFLNLGKWVLNDTNWNISGKSLKRISSENHGFFFGVEKILEGKRFISFDQEIDVYLQKTENYIAIQSLDTNSRILSVVNTENERKNKTFNLAPGELIYFDLINGEIKIKL